jgi:hypothetical protein
MPVLPFSVVYVISSDWSDAFADMPTVPAPDAEPTFRNRWIKTQLCRYAEGNVLYIDTDTLMRGSALFLERPVINGRGSAPGSVRFSRVTRLSESIMSDPVLENLASKEQGGSLPISNLS